MERGKDGTDIAGTRIEVYNNTFRAPETPVVIRGVPRDVCEVHHNWFLKHADPNLAVRASERTKVFVTVPSEKSRPRSGEGERRIQSMPPSSEAAGLA